MPSALRSGVLAALAALVALGGGAALPGPATAADGTSLQRIRPDRDVVLGLIVRKDSLAVTNRSLEATVARAGGEPGESRSITPTLGVVDFATPLTFAEAAPLAAALERRPDVVAVGPNRRVFTLASPDIPDDPLFGQQWDLWDGGGPVDYGTRAADLWPRTRGSGSVVVGVIDTGSTTHPDLGGTTVPGFDFIEDAASARDGNAWDSNPADEGDWCPQDGVHSDWHGTHVQGIVNAVQDNGIGVSGLAPAVKVQHLRVIGACEGSGADILAAVIWGSGGRVNDYYTIPGQDPGLNPTPASVLNMSLGGAGDCDPVSQSIFDEARLRGTTIVAAAGNESTSVSTSWPANCQGVLAVASGTRSGTLSSFSNFGTAAGQITLTAPGDTITSTINKGTTAPGAPGYGAMSGTSMAAPHVAAAAAILYSLGVTRPDDVVKALQAAVRPFPRGSGCDVVRCGAGLLDVSLLRGPGPALTPGAPTAVTGRALTTTSARVTWTAPVDDGGAVLTEYVVQASQDGSADVELGHTGPAATSMDVTGLQPGSTYSFTVTAVNSVGAGPASVASAPVIMPTAIVTTPGPVRDVTRGDYRWTGADYRVTVRWKRPADDGGAAITGYVARLGLNGSWSRWSALSTPTALLTKLRPVKRYTLAIRAVNSAGRGTVTEYSFMTPRSR